MTDKTTSTAAETAEQSQQNSHLMKLPVELRLRIYKFAFEDLVHDIVADAATKRPTRCGPQSRLTKRTILSSSACSVAYM